MQLVSRRASGVHASMDLATVMPLLAICNVTGFIANCFVFYCAWCFCYNRSSASSSSSHVHQLIISMTLADLIYCSFVFPMNMYYQSGASLSSELCVAYFFVARFSHVASVLSLLALNVDKFLYIAVPFHYQMIVTTIRVRVVIMVIWILSLSLGGFSISLSSELGLRPSSSFNSTSLDTSVGAIANHSVTPTSIPDVVNRCRYKSNLFLQLIGPILFYILPVLLSLVLSVRILIIVLRHRRNLIDSLEPALSRKYARKLWRAVCFVLFTTVASAILILPYWVVYMTSYFCKCISIAFQSKAMVNFPALNAVVNPVITTLTQKHFRREAMKSLQRILPCSCVRSCFAFLASTGRKLSVLGRSRTGSSALSGTDDSANNDSGDDINVLVHMPERIRLREERRTIRRHARHAAIFEGNVIAVRGNPIGIMQVDGRNAEIV